MLGSPLYMAPEVLGNRACELEETDVPLCDPSPSPPCERSIRNATLSAKLSATLNTLDAHVLVCVRCGHCTAVRRLHTSSCFDTVYVHATFTYVFLALTFVLLVFAYALLVFAYALLMFTYVLLVLTYILLALTYILFVLMHVLLLLTCILLVLTYVQPCVRTPSSCLRTSRFLHVLQVAFTYVLLIDSGENPHPSHPSYVALCCPFFVVIGFRPSPALPLPHCSHADDAKADLWSTGAVLYELVTAKHPFGGANQVRAPF